MTSLLQQLHALATTGFIIAAYLVFFSAEVIDSMLALIMAFMYEFFLTLLTSTEFIAYLFIVIYVGAIAILFLFIVMMIDVKRTKAKLSGNIFLFAIAIFISILIFDTMSDYLALNVGLTTEANRSILFDALSDIYYFSQVLFGYYSLLVLLAGIILLIAMIGAVTLTQNLNESHSKNKNIHIINEKKKSKATYINLYSSRK
jgi:NADH-quinone oxidoreductase subunit J